MEMGALGALFIIRDPEELFLAGLLASGATHNLPGHITRLQTIYSILDYRFVEMWARYAGRRCIMHARMALNASALTWSHYY